MVGEIVTVRGLLAAGGTVYNVINSRKAKRAHQRLEKALSQLKVQVCDLESKCRKLADEEDEDLLLSIVESLLDDDETAKVPYYAAIIERQLEGACDREQLRRLVVAFKALSAKELGLLSLQDPKRVLSENNDDWISVGLPARLAYLGLYNSSSGTTYGSRFTAIGQLAIETARKAQQGTEL